MGMQDGGCCIHRLVNEIDAGEIFARRDYCFPDSLRYPVDFDAHTFAKAKALLTDWLNIFFVQGHPGKSIPIDESGSEYWPRINTEVHGWIDFSWGLEDLLKFCNGFSYPYPGARTLIKGVVVEIKKISIEFSSRFHPFQNGLVFRIWEGDIYVAHKEGVIRIQELNISKASLRVKLGDRFYTPSHLLDSAMMHRVQYLPTGELVVTKN